MNLNASIIDQRLVGVQDEIKVRAEEEFGIHDKTHLKSLAFVYLCVKTMLDLDADETFDCLTDGGGDFGVDALHISEDIDGEFFCTLFQGKYKRNLKGDSNFEQKGIETMISAIRHIFNPSSDLGQINARLQEKVEHARSLIKDGVIPRVRAIACNNGLKWNVNAQKAIDRANFGSQVNWEYVNQDTLINIMQSIKPVNGTLRMTGKIIVEDMNYSRVCIGRIRVSEVAALMHQYGERLLERNIRRYLGLHGNRVNEGIRATLNSTEPANFYLFSNGLTLACDDFSYNALQDSDNQIKIENLQIVNGGQTCMTILKISDEFQSSGKNLPPEAAVLVRIYKLPKDNEDIVLQITHATNSQNPVDLKDLHANDARQKQLGESIDALGYVYRRKRMTASSGPADISTGSAAVATLAVWRQSPHQAKFFTREHFGKLYDKIFSDSLNGAQVVIAVLLYRISENHRRRPHADDATFVRYASCFIAMQMGRRLLHDMGIDLSGLDHRNFHDAKNEIERRWYVYFRLSCKDVQIALDSLYGKNKRISPQQLSATFRRGDLIEKLLQIKL